jgi:hypothetical protein
MSSRTETELGSIEGGRKETKTWRNVVRQRNRRTETRLERKDNRTESQRMIEKRSGKPENYREKVRNPENDGEKGAES